MRDEELKVGDFIKAGRGFTERIYRIDRVTPTLYVSGGTKFNRKTGKVVGTEGWNVSFWRKATADDLKKARIANTQEKLRAFTVNESNLEAVASFLKAMQEVKQEAPTVAAQGEGV